MNVSIDISGLRLKTERLLLREFRPADLHDLYAYARVEKLGRMAGWEPHKNIRESREVLNMFIRGRKTLALEHEGRVIGSVGIERYDEKYFPELQNKKGREIGYVLSQDYWGRGLMPEAVKAVEEYLFRERGLDFLICGYSEENFRSMRVQQKCGFSFSREGEFKTGWGEIRKVRYSLLSSEQYFNKK